MFKIFGLFSWITAFFRLGPKQYFRQRLKLPVIHFIHSTVQVYKAKTETGVNNVREVLLRGSIVALFTSVLVWLSIFMYLAFYYAYVPAISHERPVYLQFKACEKERGICNFPSAHVQLSKRHQLLMMGQPYKIHLDLEVPESPANKELGMFMVCADFQGVDGKILASSCRSTMLHYRSSLLEIIYKLVFSPMFVFGGAEEKQHLDIELFSEYQENESQPVTDVYFEIQSRYVEIYSAKFFINAHFSGLRYVMFHWPILSAAIGISSNLFFIAVVCMISWYQLIHSEEYKNFVNDRNEVQKYDTYKTSSEEDSSSIDDTSLLEDTKEENEERPYPEGRKYIQDVIKPDLTD